MHTQALPLVTSLFLCIPLMAQQGQDGANTLSGPVSSPHPYAAGAGKVWSHTFQNPGATRARLDLSIDLGAGDVLVLKDFAGVEQWRYSGRGPTGQGFTSAVDLGATQGPLRFLSGPVDGSSLTIELQGNSGGYGVDVHGVTWSKAPMFTDGLAGRCDLSEVLPAASETMEGSAASSFPWGQTGPMRVMYSYGRTTAGFDRPVRICGIRFRPDGGVTSSNAVDYDFRLDVSTSRREALNLDPMFANNHGADRVTVFDGLLNHPASTGLGGVPNEFVLEVPFSTPFEWDPRCGPLLFDISYRGASNTPGHTWDGPTGSGIDAGRIVHNTSSNGAVSTFPSGGVTQDFVLAVELCLEADVTPVATATVEGNSSSSYPFNRLNPMRVMYAYDESTIDFAGRHKISALSWRTQNGAAYGGANLDLRITLSTGAAAANALSATFDANHGADQTVVFDGIHVADPAPAGTSPGPFVVTIPLSTPFEYNPANGPLVVDMQLRAPSDSGGTAFDGVFNTEPVYRVYDASSSNANSGTVQNFGLVMGLSAEPTPTIPESDDSTFGSSSSSFPFNATTQQRAMYQYGAAAIATTRPLYIQHLSWRTNAGAGSFGPAAYTCTIDLSTSTVPAGSLTTTFDSNHGADRAQVFDGTFSVPYIADNSDPQLFPISVKLDTPFYYDPANGPLLVDIRVLDTIGSTVSLDGSFGPGMQRVVHRTNANGTVANFGPQGFGLDIRLSGDGCNATSINYGTACPGTNGAPIAINLGLPTLPSNDFGVGMLNGTPTSFAFLSIGLTQTNNPLDTLGAPNCFGLTGGEIGVLGVPTDASGAAVVPLPLPNIPSLSGFRFMTQWAALDAGANNLGIVFSDAQIHTTCN